MDDHDAQRRAALGAFLRSRRERLTPADVGLANDPGLRRSGEVSFGQGEGANPNPNHDSHTGSGPSRSTGTSSGPSHGGGDTDPGSSHASVASSGPSHSGTDSGPGSSRNTGTSSGPSRGGVDTGPASSRTATASPGPSLGGADSGPGSSRNTGTSSGPSRSGAAPALGSNHGGIDSGPGLSRGAGTNSSPGHGSADSGLDPSRGAGASSGASHNGAALGPGANDRGADSGPGSSRSTGASSGASHRDAAPGPGSNHGGTDSGRGSSRSAGASSGPSHSGADSARDSGRASATRPGQSRASARRRTPGLRREEVALLSGVSVSWYSWLEQGRPIAASRQVLDALAATLRLTAAERRHVFELAGEGDGSAGQAPADGCPAVGEHLRATVAALAPVPACVLDLHWDILAYNEAEAALYGGLDHLPPSRRNMIWLYFGWPGMRTVLKDFEAEAWSVLEQFRASADRNVGDPRFEEILADVTDADPDFPRRWERHDVAAFTPALKRFTHPQYGPLTFRQTKLLAAESPDLHILARHPADPSTRRAMEAMDAMAKEAARQDSGAPSPS